MNKKKKTNVKITDFFNPLPKLICIYKLFYCWPFSNDSFNMATQRLAFITWNDNDKFNLMG